MIRGAFLCELTHSEASSSGTHFSTGAGVRKAGFSWTSVEEQSS